MPSLNRPVHGVVSHYTYDFQVSDKVEVIGPFGASFLMPIHPHSNIVMICTGTDAGDDRMAPAPAPAQVGQVRGGRLILFSAHARSRNCLTSARSKTCRKTSSTSTSRSRACLAAPSAMCRAPCASAAPTWRCFYTCALKSTGECVVLALRDVAEQAGLDWDAVGAVLKIEGWLCLETC